MSVQEFLTYVRVVLKRWWLFLILCGTTLGGIWFSFQAGPPQYEAAVRFAVNAPPSADVTLYPGFDRPTQGQAVAVIQATFMELLKSPTVIRRAVEASQVSIGSDELRRRVKVEEPLESQFVWVSVQADDPQEAADLANTLVDTAKQYYGQLLAEPSASAREFISAQVEAALQDLQDAKKALVDFRREHQISDLSAEIESQRTIVWNLILAKDGATVDRKTEEVSTYGQLILKHQAELQRLTALSDEYEALQESINRTESNYTFLKDKETEAKLKENEVLQVAFIQVVESARPPAKPVSPFNMQIFAVGGVLSLVVSVVIAFLLEYLESGQAKRTQDETLVCPSGS